MLVRSRRADAPVSNSASTTIFPLTMCSPPANRSIEATSALRQHVFVNWVLDSSAFTCAVIAMRQILPCQSITLGTADALVGSGQLGRIMARGAIADGHVRDDQPGAVRRDQLLDLVVPRDRGAVGQHGVHAQVGSVLGEHREVVARPETGGLPR